LVNSDKLKDTDASPVAMIVKERTSVEEARLNGARARLTTSRDSLTTFCVAIFGSSPRTVAWLAVKVDEDEAEEKRERKDGKLLERKLLAPNDGWLDTKGIFLHSYQDRHRLLQHVLNVF